jgi:hypothetical protein
MISFYYEIIIKIQGSIQDRTQRFSPKNKTEFQTF